MTVRLDLLDQALLLQPCHDLLAGYETIKTVEIGDSSDDLGIWIATFKIKIGIKKQLSFWRQNINWRIALHRIVFMTLPHLEIAKVVRRRDLDRTAALLLIGDFVADYRNRTADQRQDNVLTDYLLVAFIFRMNCNGCVAQHRLRPRGGDDNVGRGIARIE